MSVDTTKATMLLDETLKEMHKADKSAKAENKAEQTTDSDSPSIAKAPKRVRCFSGITYIDEQAVIKFLKTAPWVQHWSVAYHDKDVWTLDDEKDNPKHVHGTAKENHTHILLYTYDGKTSSSVLKKIEGLARTVNPENPQNTKMQICNDGGAMYRYQLHKDDPDKYPYVNEVRKCDDISYWEKLSATDGMTSVSSNSGLAMVQSVLDGATEREMCERYGKEWIYHRKYVLESVHRIQYEERTVTEPKVDEAMLRLMFEASPFHRIDIEKFFEMLDYIKKQSIECYGGKPDFSLYFEQEEKQ